MATVKVFCPTGTGGGIDPTCKPKGGGGGAYTAPVKDGNGKIAAGSVGSFSGVDTSKWDGSKFYAQWALKKIAKLEKLAHAGDLPALKGAVSTPGEKMNSYQKTVVEAQTALLKKLQGEVVKVADPDNLGGLPVQANPAVLDASSWKKVGSKLGSEPAAVYEDANGQKFYVKTPNDPARAHNEVLSGGLYELAGVGSIKAQLAEIDGKTAVVSKWDDSLKAINPNSPDDVKQLWPSFAAHAWLNNWDGMGVEFENTKLSANGTPVCVDAGGCLDKNAIAKATNKPFGPYPGEMATLIDSKVNPTMAKVFGGMGPLQAIASFKSLETVDMGLVKKLIDKVSDKDADGKAKLFDTLAKRRLSILAAGKALATQQGVDWDSLEPSLKPPKQPTGKAAALAGEINAGLAIPAPPVITPSLQKLLAPKIAAIQKAAADLDMDALSKIKASTKTSSPYYKAVATWKMQVEDAVFNKLAWGQKEPAKTAADDLPTGTTAKTAVTSPTGDTKPAAVQTPPPPPKPTKPPEAPKPPEPDTDQVKIDVDKLAKPYKFQSSIKHQVEANEKIQNAAYDLIKSGKVEEFLEMAKSKTHDGQAIKSPALKQHLDALANQVKKQLYAPKPVAALDAHVADMVANFKANYAGAKVAKTWVDVGSIGAVPTNKPVGDYDSTTLGELNAMGQAAVPKMGDVKSTIKQYTGSSYSWMNDQLIEGKPSEAVAKLAKAMVKKAPELPVGMGIVRHHAKPPDIDMIQPGTVYASKSLLSTSSNESGASSFRHYPVEWRMTAGPGVKGLPVQWLSSHKGEYEVLLPPNQRLYVTHVEVGVDTPAGKNKHVIHAYILPTEDAQADGL